MKNTKHKVDPLKIELWDNIPKKGLKSLRIIDQIKEEFKTLSENFKKPVPYKAKRKSRRGK